MTEDEWLACAEPSRMLESLRGEASDRKLRLFAVACCRRISWLLTHQAGRDAFEVAERYADRQAPVEERLAAFRTAVKEAALWTNCCSTVENAIAYAAGAAAFVLAKEETVEDEAAAAGASDVVIMARAIHREIAWHTPAMIVALDAASAVGAAVIAFLDEEDRLAAGEQADYLEAEIQNLTAGLAYAKAMGFSRSAAVPTDRMVAAEEARRAEGRSQCDLLRCIFGNPFRDVGVDASWLARNEGTIVKLADYMYRESAFDRLPVLADALEEAGCQDPHILAHCRRPSEHVRGCWVVDLLLGKG